MFALSDVTVPLLLLFLEVSSESLRHHCQDMPSCCPAVDDLECAFQSGFQVWGRQETCVLQNGRGWNLLSKLLS